MIVVASAGGVALAVRAAAEDMGRVAWPTSTAIGLAALFLTLTVTVNSFAWSVILDAPQRRLAVVGGFLIAQMGKYVPGGVVQIAGQIGMARRGGADGVRAAVALVVHAGTTVGSAGGAAAVVFAVVADATPTWIRLLLGVGGTVVAVLVLVARSFGPVLDVAVGRWRVVPPDSVLPEQRSILLSAVLGGAGALAYGAAFVALVGPTSNRVAVGAGFFVAFTVGFALLPVPSGLGVRELVALVLLEPYAPVTALVACGVALRVVQLAVELVLAFVSLIVARPGAPTSRG